MISKFAESDLAGSRGKTEKRHRPRNGEVLGTDGAIIDGDQRCPVLVGLLSGRERDERAAVADRLRAHRLRLM